MTAGGAVEQFTIQVRRNGDGTWRPAYVIAADGDRRRTIRASGAGTVYYSTSPFVTSSTYDGTLTAGSSLTIAATVYVQSSSVNVLTITDSVAVGSSGVGIQLHSPTGIQATDTADMVAALATAAADGECLVQAQPGDYEVNIGQIVVPANTVLAGSGLGVTTLHKRATGVLVDMSGTNETTGRKAYAQVRDLSINGHDNTGSAVRQYYTTQSHLTNVGVSFNNDTALDIVSVWDTNYYNMLLDWCGSYDGTNAAIRIRNSAAASGFGAASTQQTNMLNFAAMRIESFRNALDIGRGTGSSIDPYGIYFNTLKMETSFYRGQFVAVANVRHVHLDKVDITVNGFDSGISAAGSAILWSPLFNSSLRNIRFYQPTATFLYHGIQAYHGAGSHSFDGIGFEGAGTAGGGVIDWNVTNACTVNALSTAAGTLETQTRPKRPGAPTITGSRAGNAALASLLTQLAGQGYVIDSTTA